MPANPESCYMCSNPATTVEHVPPKCIFPEEKDVGGMNFRSNLITVPSCEEHNCKKSSDDEFLMVSIAGIIGNNSIGYWHSRKKVERALRRSSYKLLDKIFLKKESIRVEIESNKFLDFIVGTPDYERLIDCFSKVSYGIYRHHYKETFRGEIKPYLGFLHNNENNPKAFRDFIRHKTALELANEPRLGENPKVFYYHFTKPDQFGIFLLKMCFYEGVDVYVSFIPEAVEKPGLFAMELINIGVKTIVRLDGKTYEFN